MAAPDKKKTVKIIKKKISPYPIEGELVQGAVKVALNIIMLSPKGLVANIKAGICQVGRRYQCQFILPQSRLPVQVEGKVFKTFDRSVDPKNAKRIERVTEVLFMNMNDVDKEKIVSFMKAIGQKE